MRYREERGGGRSGTIYRYVAREFALSFTVAFFFFFVVFFVNQLLLMAEDILSKKAPIEAVLRLLLFAMPSIVAMSFPFASLVGALMAVGRMSSENEILVIQASGVPTRRIFAPFAFLGLVFSIVSFVMNDYYLPLGIIEYGKLYRQLLISSPALELKPWSVRRYRDVSIVTGGVDGTVVADLLIFDRTEDGRGRVIAAERASLQASRDDRSIILALEGVWTQTIAKDKPDRFEYSSCESMEYRLETKDGVDATASVGPRDMSSFDLYRVIAEKRRAFADRIVQRSDETARARAELERSYEGAQAESIAWENARSRVTRPLAAYRELARDRLTDRSLQIYLLEYYKKFSIPFGSLCFVFLAFPLGMKARRSGRSVGFGLGLLVAVLYWALLLGGQTLGSRLSWPPFWAMWAPNAFVLVGGLVVRLMPGTAR